MLRTVWKDLFTVEELKGMGEEGLPFLFKLAVKLGVCKWTADGNGGLTPEWRNRCAQQGLSKDRGSAAHSVALSGILTLCALTLLLTSAMRRPSTRPTAQSSSSSSRLPGRNADYEIPRRRRVQRQGRCRGALC